MNPDITLLRRRSSERSTLGQLFVADWSCVTLEDPERAGPKIAGATAIPRGRYRLVLTFSPRFQQIMPELLAVPGFSGVRIHRGNGPLDTEGCILVGLAASGEESDRIIGSRAAYAKLCELLCARFARDPEQWLVVAVDPSDFEP